MANTSSMTRIRSIEKQESLSIYVIIYLQKQQRYEYYSTLSFTIRLPRKPDIIQLAFNFPYTYHQLQQHLLKFAQKKMYSTIFNSFFFSLCTSLLGNECYYFDIKPQNDNKSIIVVMARQHPIETLSSYFMEYFLDDFLLSNSLESRWLKNNYHWIILPMVNIDGVIVGNSRCDVAGIDLNRTWKAPNKKLNPIVYNFKKLLKSYVNEGSQIKMFIDLHGHSTKYNSFCYGCTPSIKPVSTRMFPLIFDQTSYIFDMKQCVFAMSKDRQNTARIVMFEELKVNDSYTIETSYFGHNKQNQLKQFQFSDLKALSQQFLKSIFYYQEASSSIYKNATKEIDDHYQMYIDLNKNEPDQSESDENIDEESMIPEEEIEEVKPVEEKKEKKKKVIKPKNNKLNILKPLKRMPKQVPEQKEEKKVEQKQIKQRSISPIPKSTKPKPQTTQQRTEVSRSYQPQSTSVGISRQYQKKLPDIEQNSILKFVERQTMNQNKSVNDERKKRNNYYERTKTMYTPTKNSVYQDKIRFRQRLNNMKLLSQFQYDSVVMNY